MQCHHLVEVISRYSDLYMMYTIKLNDQAKVSGHHNVDSTGEDLCSRFGDVHGGSNPQSIKLEETNMYNTKCF